MALLPEPEHDRAELLSCLPCRRRPDRRRPFGSLAGSFQSQGLSPFPMTWPRTSEQNPVSFRHGQGRFRSITDHPQFVGRDDGHDADCQFRSPGEVAEDQRNPAFRQPEEKRRRSTQAVKLRNDQRTTLHSSCVTQRPSQPEGDRCHCRSRSPRTPPPTERRCSSRTERPSGVVLRYPVDTGTELRLLKITCHTCSSRASQIYSSVVDANHNPRRLCLFVGVWHHRCVTPAAAIPRIRRARGRPQEPWEWPGATPTPSSRR